MLCSTQTKPLLLHHGPGYYTIPPIQHHLPSRRRLLLAGDFYTNPVRCASACECKCVHLHAYGQPSSEPFRYSVAISRLCVDGLHVSRHGQAHSAQAERMQSNTQSACCLHAHNHRHQRCHHNNTTISHHHRRHHCTVETTSLPIIVARRRVFGARLSAKRVCAPTSRCISMIYGANSTRCKYDDELGLGIA